MGGIHILTGSVHLEVNSLAVNKRIDQVRALLSAIPDSIDHVIIGGDFNTMVQNTIDSVDSMLKNSGYLNATKNIEYTISSMPFGWLKLKLDHIYVKGFDEINSGIIKESRASDHYPVWTKLIKIREY